MPVLIFRDTSYGKYPPATDNEFLQKYECYFIIRIKLTKSINRPYN